MEGSKILVPFRTSGIVPALSMDWLAVERGCEDSPGSQFSLMVSAADVCLLGVLSVQTAFRTHRTGEALNMKRNSIPACELIVRDEMIEEIL